MSGRSGFDGERPMTSWEDGRTGAGRMRVLMLGRWLPVPRRHEMASRAYRFARALARRHDVTLAFVSDEANPVGGVQALRAEFGDIEFAAVPRSWQRLASAVRAVTGASCTIAYQQSAALQRRLADRVRTFHYDLVVVLQSGMIGYALGLPRHLPVLMDFGGVDSEWWMQQAARRSAAGASFCRTEGARLRLAEAAIARQAARCLVSSPFAARLVARFEPRGPVSVVPDGLEEGFFVPGGPVRRPPRVAWVSPLDDTTLVRHAAEFCEAGLPRLRRRIPDVELVLVGREAHASVRALGRRAGVVIAAPTGDVRAHLSGAIAAIAPVDPVRGIPEGLLQAMAGGVPTVTTRRTSEGLGARPGREVLVADEPGTVADRIAELAESGSLRSVLGPQGAAFVRGRYAWDVIETMVVELATATASRCASGPGPQPVLAPLELG
jgi:glycosyltransferase involved in cell wall biosynthesis